MIFSPFISKLFARILDWLAPFPPPPIPPQEHTHEVRADWLAQKLALQFVQIVQDTVARGEICILYAEGSIGLSSDRTKIWPSMRQQIFRDAVTALFPHGSFSPPDEYDDWTYAAYPRRAYDRARGADHAAVSIWCPVRGFIPSCDGFGCIGARCGLLHKQSEIS